MEENEWAFCSLWTKKIEIRCATALVNPRLEGDYFFSRATVENCDVPYEQVAKVFWDAGIDCHLYFFKSPPQGLRVADTMYVLRSTKKAGHNDGRIRIVVCKSSEEVATWVDVFCRSFSVPRWKDEVARIMAASAKRLDLLLAYNEDNLPAGCAALFTKSDNSMTGTYCLGTIPAYRNKGVARSILNFAKALAEKRGSLLFLQTLGSENLLGLYKSAGFEIAYTKTICSVPRTT